MHQILGVSTDRLEVECSYTYLRPRTTWQKPDENARSKPRPIQLFRKCFVSVIRPSSRKQTHRRRLSATKSPQYMEKRQVQRPKLRITSQSRAPGHDILRRSARATPRNVRLDSTEFMNWRVDWLFINYVKKVDQNETGRFESKFFPPFESGFRDFQHVPVTEIEQ